MSGQPEALLLLGPTGSGKTPLGEVLEARGLGGRRCVHFDFGRILRRVVARGEPDGAVSAEEIAFLEGVLERGALLEDERFPLAERLLRRFLESSSDGGRRLTVLNGLPRHRGQADGVGRILAVRTVVVLGCPAEVLMARLAANVGGDRTGRTDDDLAAVTRKLAIFSERTEPLVAYYGRRGARVVRLPVRAETTAVAMWRELTRRVAGGEAGAAGGAD